MSLNAVELNAEIERIEAGIVLREARLRGRVADLSERVEAALPKAAAAGVVAAALGGALLWLRPRRHQPAPASAAAASGGEAPGGWLHWVNMAWPMLPMSLRAMVDLQLVIAIGKPLLALFKRRPAAARPARPARPAPPGSPGSPAAPPADAAHTRG